MIELDNDILSNLGRKTHSLCELFHEGVDDDGSDSEAEQTNSLKVSSYIGQDELSCIIPDYNTSFSVFSSNIQSMNTSFNEVKFFVQNLREINFEFSVLCFQECFISKDCILNYDIPSYTTFISEASCGRNGGLITYIHKSFECKPLTDIRPSQPDLWEGHFLCVSSKALTSSVIVGNVYRPPRDEHDFFINDFSNCLAKLKTNNKELIINGDFNLNLLRIDSDHKVDDFYQMITSYGLYPKITLPTRFSDNDATLIDNCFCKISPKTCDSFAGILTKRFSDHQPYFSCFNDLKKNACEI